MSEEKKKPSNEKRHGSVIQREYRKHYEKRGPRVYKYWVDEVARVNVVLVGRLPQEMSVHIHSWDDRDGFNVTAPFFNIKMIADTKDNQLAYMMTYQEEGFERMKMATTFKPILRTLVGIDKHNIITQVKREMSMFLRQEAIIRSGEPFVTSYSDDDVDEMLEEAQFESALDKMLEEE